MAPNNSSTILPVAIASAVALAWFAYSEGKRCGRLEAKRKAFDGHAPTSDVDGRDVTRDGNKSRGPTTRASSTTVHINPKAKSITAESFESLPIYPIATLHSIYRLCVGTPRQVRRSLLGISVMYSPLSLSNTSTILSMPCSITGNVGTPLQRHHHLPRKQSLERLDTGATKLFTRLCSLCVSFE